MLNLCSLRLPKVFFITGILILIGINIFDDIKDASRFKIKYNPTFQTLFDKNRTIPVDFGVVGVQETYFVKDNTIFFKYIGKVTEKILDEGYRRTKNE